ncbi:MAG TPA: GNAT family N-acetyltransferase [Novosphingobium sp.]
MIAIEYHADLKEVQSLAHLSGLLSADMQAAPFDRLAWWMGLVEHCGRAPLLAVAREGDAMAVLALQHMPGHLAALANWYTFRWRPVASANADLPALLSALARDLARRSGRIVLSGLPDEDGSATMIEAAFRRAGWLVFREASDTNHILDVGGRTYDDYLAARPGPLRTTLKRKSGKVETRVLDRFDAETWRDYEAIYAQSWKPDEGSPAFLRDFAASEGSAGRLRLGLALADGRPVAAQMWSVEGGTAFIHKLAHIEEAKPLSPGSVLSAALFRRVIDGDRVHTIDFGTGDDSYKRDWMELARPRYRLDMVRAGRPENWPYLVKRTLRSLAGRGKHG